MQDLSLQAHAIVFYQQVCICGFCGGFFLFGFLFLCLFWFGFCFFFFLLAPQRVVYWLLCNHFSTGEVWESIIFLQLCKAGLYRSCGRQYCVSQGNKGNFSYQAI